MLKLGRDLISPMIALCAEQNTFLAVKDGMEAEMNILEKNLMPLFASLRKEHNNHTPGSVAASMAGCEEKCDTVTLFLEILRELRYKGRR